MANLAPGASAPALHEGTQAARPPYTMRGAMGGNLVLALAPDVGFDALRNALRAGFGETPGRYAGARMRIDLGGRDLDLYDLRRLVHMLKGEFGADVVGLHCGSDTLRRFAERELKLKVYLEAPVEDLAPPPAPPAPEPDVSETPTELVSQPSPEEDEPDQGGRLLTIDGTVRSGAVVRFPGDVQVFGDVNPGAQVIAGGNVLVFGALKGLAHAGYRGDERAVILAFDMRPTQLRIGKVIQVSSRADAPEREARHVAPEIAYIGGGGIVVEPYRGRLPGHASKESS